MRLYRTRLMCLAIRNDLRSDRLRRVYRLVSFGGYAESDDLSLCLGVPEFKAKEALWAWTRSTAAMTAFNRFGLARQAGRSRAAGDDLCGFLAL